jgi:hypothetical protein
MPMHICADWHVREREIEEEIIFNMVNYKHMIHETYLK